MGGRGERRLASGDKSGRRERQRETGRGAERKGGRDRRWAKHPYKRGCNKCEQKVL